VRRHNDLPAIRRPFLASKGLPQGGFPPHGPHSLFRGRPVYPNSIFGDGSMLFPQMDVWSPLTHPLTCGPNS
jgi:hypothetical protein